jgi:hypothetical protein
VAADASLGQTMAGKGFSLAFIVSPVNALPAGGKKSDS